MPKKTKKTFDEKAYVKSLVERIVRECPKRRPTSEDEKKAQRILEEELQNVDLKTHYEPFTFNENLYANIALHFGLGTLGTLVSGVAPLAGLALHSLAGSSYLADSTRRAYILRRLFPFKPSQNLLAVLPSRGEPKLRIVLMAHADAAFTGFIFDPDTIKNYTATLPPWLSFARRGLALSTHSQFALSAFDLLRVFLGPLTWPLRPIEFLLSIPAAIAFVTNMQVVLKNEIVPGANDNLSGAAALPLLARRLAVKRHPDVEYVFVVTGCEEASLGGADALARAKEGVWDKGRTVIIGLDGMANGELHFTSCEGEVVSKPIPEWLSETVTEVAASEPRFAEVTGFQIPVGGTDVSAFLAHGWEGLSLVCLDPEIGAPLHYHLPTDTPENLDVEKVIYSIDFAEKLVRAVIDRRL